MNVRLVCALIPLLCLHAPVYAQSPCSDCLNAVENELTKCLGNAISANDKASCLDNRQAQARTCRNSECAIEREEKEEAENRNGQPQPNRAGLTPYTPTESEWLALTMQASLRREAGPDHPYSLDILLVDHDTLLILVRHPSTVNREMINKAIATAREAIRSRARSHGWDKWVKVREAVELYPTSK